MQMDGRGYSRQAGVLVSPAWKVVTIQIGSERNRMNTQVEQNQSADDRRAVCAIDWLEYRGCGRWCGKDAHQWVERLEEAKCRSALSRKEEPLEIAGHCAMNTGPQVMAYSIWLCRPLPIPLGDTIAQCPAISKGSSLRLKADRHFASSRRSTH